MPKGKGGVQKFTIFTSKKGGLTAMIYVTADLHGDATRLRTKEIRRLKKGDTLIVLGDFGFLWQGTPKEKKLLKKLGKKKYQILFLDGAHENFDLLEQYPVEEWGGGQVRRIDGNLRYLMRGQVYVIEGKRIFTMGGGRAMKKKCAPSSRSGFPKSCPVRRRCRTHGKTWNGFAGRWIMC